MKRYFEHMDQVGGPLNPQMATLNTQSKADIQSIEKQLDNAVETAQSGGIGTEKLHAKGQLSALERIHHLVDPGTFCPLHTLYNPDENDPKTTGVIDGIAQINGRFAAVIASDNRILAGAWIPGQADNILRVTDTAKRLNIPLVWILNCSGVKLDEQEKVYPNRRGNGATFYRHAQLEQMGIPVLVAVFGTNPAGGGYHAISPTVIFAHKDANMAVGGTGIVSGMSPGGDFTKESANHIISAQQELRSTPPGSAMVHRDETGFFKYVYENEAEVLTGLRNYMNTLPAFAPEFFQVATPCEPKYSPTELDHIIPLNQKQTYPVEQVVARLVDNSEHLEFSSNRGPEIYTAIVKIDGFLMGLVANRQGFLGGNYPEYADYTGIGGKLYRQGLIKLNEFVTLCGRDRLPIIWLQDTTGIDVGDRAEKAELLGLGQSLIYSIQQTDVPMLCVIIRKGTAAAHYLLGGPQANDNNAFTLGTAATEIYVMHGETAAVAAYSRRLSKEQDGGRDIQPVLDKMNALARDYHNKSRPLYCAEKGMVDEIVKLSHLRTYLKTFAGCCYQNPKSICPPHQLILPRIIRPMQY